MSQVENIRVHAATMQGLIDEERERATTETDRLARLVVYRALVDSGGYPLALALFVDPYAAPFLQVQRPYDGDDKAAVKLTHGQYITTTELAVFADLGEVDPLQTHWVRQSLPLPAQTAADLHMGVTT